MLFEMAHEWTALLRKRTSVLKSKYMLSPGALSAYRHLASELGLPAGVKEVAIVFSDGREERLRP